VFKLYVDTKGMAFTASKPSEPKLDQNGQQKSERGTGRLMWTTQVIVLTEDGAEVIAVTTHGEKPSVMVGQSVQIVGLEAIPWATNGRNGTAFRATDLRVLASASGAAK